MLNTYQLWNNAAPTRSNNHVFRSFFLFRPIHSFKDEVVLISPAVKMQCIHFFSRTNRATKWRGPSPSLPNISMVAPAKEETNGQIVSLMRFFQSKTERDAHILSPFAPLIYNYIPLCVLLHRMILLVNRHPSNWLIQVHCSFLFRLLRDFR